ncbi:hypothetical protein bAD24_p01400 (plasmid) [Burkholderia sp. AD24]|nr:hypothetical protein bAD24_p01400 [Burkholderia sp. AD24]
MTDFPVSNVSPGSESPELLDAACIQVRDMTQARCAVVIVIDGDSGSGYSIVGPLDAQILLPDILRKVADSLRGQLASHLQ